MAQRKVSSVIFAMLFSAIIHCISSAIASDIPETHVVLIAGQSNSVGTDTMDNSDKKIKYPEEVMQVGRRRQKDMKIIPAKYPLHHHRAKPGRFGFALQFSIDYMKARPHVRLILVPSGKGSTGFSSGDWGVGTYLYNDSVKRANRALEEKNARLVAILWAQGEHDVKSRNTTKHDYMVALDAQLNAWRNDIHGAKDVPIVLGQMVPAFIERRDRKGISEVIAETPERVPNTYVVSGEGAEFYGESTPDDPSDDQIIHYSANGYRTMGSRFADVVLGLP